MAELLDAIKHSLAYLTKAIGEPKKTIQREHRPLYPRRILRLCYPRFYCLRLYYRRQVSPQRPTSGSSSSASLRSSASISTSA